MIQNLSRLIAGAAVALALTAAASAEPIETNADTGEPTVEAQPVDTDALTVLERRREALVEEIAELERQRQAEKARLLALQEAVREEAKRLAALKQQVLVSSPPWLDGDVAEQPVAAGSTSDKRVFVHYSLLQESGAALASRVAEDLTAGGYAVEEIRPVRMRLSAMSVRFFFPEDESATPTLKSMVAESLEEEGLDVPARVQDFTHFDPKPRPGTLEVWIPSVAN